MLQSKELRTQFAGRALNYLEVFYIGREGLYAVCRGFPRSFKAVRRRVIFLALRHYLSKTVREAKMEAARLEVEAARPQPPPVEPSRDPLDDVLDAPVPNLSRLQAVSPIPVELREAVRAALSEALLTRSGPWAEGGAARDAVVALLHARRPDRIGKLYLHVDSSGLRAGGLGSEDFMEWWQTSGIRESLDVVSRTDSLRGDMVDDVARLVQRRLETWSAP